MSMVEQPAPALVTAHAWEPGPSFVDVQDAELDYSGIPSWLQSFGDSVGEQTARVESQDPAPIDAPALRAASNEPLLPGWLEEPRSTPAGAPFSPSVSGDPVSDDGTGFISEDDLPEWLRSIGDEPTDGEEFSFVGATTATVNGTSNGAIRIPTVSMVWVASHQMIALAPGESLFARIANEDFSLVPADDVPAPSPSVSSAPTALVEAVPAPVPAKGGGRMRLYLLTGLVLVSLLLAVLMMSQR